MNQSICDYEKEKFTMPLIRFLSRPPFNARTRCSMFEITFYTLVPGERYSYDFSFLLPFFDGGQKISHQWMRLHNQYQCVHCRTQMTFSFASENFKKFSSDERININTYRKKVYCSTQTSTKRIFCSLFSAAQMLYRHPFRPNWDLKNGFSLKHHYG